MASKEQKNCLVLYSQLSRKNFNRRRWQSKHQKSKRGKMRFGMQNIESDRRGAHAARRTMPKYGPWEVPFSRGRCANFLGRAHNFKSHPDDKSTQEGKQVLRSRNRTHCYLVNQPKRIVTQRNRRTMVPVSTNSTSWSVFGLIERIYNRWIMYDHGEN